MVRGRWLGPLGARLALAFVAVALAAVAVLGGLTLVASRSEVTDLVSSRQDQDAVEIAATLAQAYEQADGWADADLSGAFALTASAQGDLVVLGSDGQLVARGSASMAELMGRMHGQGMMSVGELGDPRRVDVEVDGATVGTAVLRFPASSLPAPEREVRDALARTVLTGGGIAALAALTVAVFVSRCVTRPVVALTKASQRLEAGDIEARVDLVGAPGELGELADAFDQMADSLRHQDELRRALVADVAHELRTPATILQAACEELVDGLAEPTPERLGSLHDEVLRLGRVIHDLEAMASAQAAGLHLERRPVDVADVAAQAADLLQPRFDDAGTTLSTTTTPVTVDGDADRLHQITVNLLTNALKFTPPGGTVTLTVEPFGELAKLEVSDRGPASPLTSSTTSSSGSGAAPAPPTGPVAASAPPSWPSSSRPTAAGSPPTAPPATAQPSPCCCRGTDTTHGQRDPPQVSCRRRTPTPARRSAATTNSSVSMLMARGVRWRGTRSRGRARST